MNTAGQQQALTVALIGKDRWGVSLRDDPQSCCIVELVNDHLRCNCGIHVRHDHTEAVEEWLKVPQRRTPPAQPIRPTTSLMEDPRTAKLLETLTAQVTALQTQTNTLADQLRSLSKDVRVQPMLGLSDGRMYIFIERDKGVLWHTFEDEEPVPIHSKVLRGYVAQVFKKEGDYAKLHVHINGDREYVIVTGFETYFGRELLAGICTLTEQQLQRPVVIKPDTGKDEGKSKHKPVFCNLISDGRLVKPGTRRNMDINVLFQQAQEALGQKPTAAPAPARISVVPSPTKAAPSVAQESVNWQKVCADLNITTAQLLKVARQLKLPHGKLNRSQSAQLYQEIYQEYAQVS